jgi:hypothetical protein
MWYYILMPIVAFLALVYFVHKIEKERHPENASQRWRDMQ